VKRCRICGAEKPLDEMVWVARKRRGRVEPSRPTTTCKVCNRAHVKAWREQNPERFREATSRYQRENRARSTAAQNRWRAENRDRVEQWQRERWERDKERLKAQNREYRRKNAPAIAAYRRRQKKQRRYGMTADALDYTELLRRDPCSYCGGPAGHADHIDPVSKGGPSTWDNLTAACKSCNSRKKAKPLLLALLYAAR
jgi:hypothetical protein